MYSDHMSSGEEIRTAIERLSKKELTHFRRWFVRYDVELWDRQIEQDVATGNLEGLKDAALREHRARRTTPL